jgi:phage shock protein C
MIAGVCGGLAEYFELDPVLVRLAFFIFTLAGGSGGFIYLALWIIMPQEP